MRTLPILTAGVAAALAAASQASAHEAAGAVSGFAEGLVHPLFGPDHVVTMVAVGLWGAFLGVPAIWLLPVVFPLVMAAGGAAGVAGVPIPSAELGIAVSAIMLGLMVGLAARPPLAVAGLLVGAFAVFHGQAHGTELPAAADPLAYSAGFVVATGFLHLVGIGFGTFARWPAGRVALRAAGGVIAAAGVAFVVRLG